MKTVKVRNVEIGAGLPKICVPIVAVTREDILAQASSLRLLPADVVEWRIDYFQDVLNADALLAVLQELRAELGETPLLMTFRTLREGGERSIEPEAYADLNIRAAHSGLVDLIDVELFTGDEIVGRIIREAHAAGVKIVASNHDFDKTPDKDEILSRLRKMQDMGADLPKIAVMPRNRRDVLTLLSATEEMASDYADRPIITMSMSGTGVISRLSGEVFGSALTFGSAGKASAPGQMGVQELHAVLQLLHNAL